MECAIPSRGCAGTYNIMCTNTWDSSTLYNDILGYSRKIQSMTVNLYGTSVFGMQGASTIDLLSSRATRFGTKLPNGTLFASPSLSTW